MLKMATILPVSAAAFSMVAFSLSASANLIIEDGDAVTPAWTVSNQVNSVTRPDGSGQPGRGLQVNYTAVEGWAGGTISTTSVTGDLSSYRGGSFDFSYRVLGVEVSPGVYQPTADHPRYASVAIVDSAGRSLNYDVQVYSAGLGWDVTDAWHTVSLHLPQNSNEMDTNREASLFDGVPGTGASLPTVAAGLGFSDVAAQWDSFWQNIARIDIHTYYVGQPGTANAAVVFDNITLVPEPAALGLVGAVSIMAVRRRRA